MSGKIKKEFSKIFGDYPTLTEKQKEYVAIMANPQTHIDHLRQIDIADQLGLSLRTLINWRKKPEIKDAIIIETRRKQSDKYSDVVNVIETILFDKKAENKDRLKAVDLWGKFYGVTEEAKSRIAAKGSSESKTVEGFIDGIGRKLGDDVEDDTDDDDPDDESEELHSGTAVDKD